MTMVGSLFCSFSPFHGILIDISFRIDELFSFLSFPSPRWLPEVRQIQRLEIGKSSLDRPFRSSKTISAVFRAWIFLIHRLIITVQFRVITISVVIPKLPMLIQLVKLKTFSRKKEQLIIQCSLDFLLSDWPTLHKWTLGPWLDCRWLFYSQRWILVFVLNRSL